MLSRRPSAARTRSYDPALAVAARATGARLIRVTECDSRPQAERAIGAEAWVLSLTPSRYPTESLERHGIDALPWEQVGYSDSLKHTVAGFVSSPRRRRAGATRVAASRPGPL